MELVFYLLQRTKTNIVSGILTGIMSGLGSAALIGFINSRLNNPDTSFDNAVLVFTGLAFLVLSTHILSTVIVMRVGQVAARDLRMELSRRIIATPLRLLQQLGAARLMANLTEDINTLVDASQIIPNLCINISWVIGCFIYLAWLSPELFMLVSFIIVSGIIIYQLSSVKVLQIFRQIRELDDTLFAHFRALIQGIKEIKLHTQRRHAFLKDVLFPTAEASCRSNISAMTIFAVAATIGTATLYLLIGMILFEASGWKNITQEIVTGYTLTVLYIMAPLTAIIGELPILSRANIALDKINQLKSELLNNPEEFNKCSQDLTQSQSSLLEFVNVMHRYQREESGQNFTLGPLNLKIQSGEMVFIIGGNGSGKSTLGLILVGLYSPESGEIRLNDKIICDSNREFYRQQFSVVFSDFYLFQCLLGLSRGHLDNTASLYLSKFKLDHKVSIENGVFSTIDLSQGQRKRLALITAYLEDRPFYVFDEWAADQDPIFKEFFYTVILSDLKARGKTVVAITHDDHYFHMADRCIRLENGQIQHSFS